MAQNEGGSEHPRAPWNGVDRRNPRDASLPREVGHYDSRKVVALLECIEFSGVDLLDGDDKIAFTERLARAKRADDRRKKWHDRRAASVVWIVSAVGSVLISLWLPEAVKWVREKF